MPGAGDQPYLYFTSPLDPEVTHLMSFSGEDAISQLFHFQIEIVHEPAQLKPEEILGQMVGFGLTDWDDNKKRHFHGLVTGLTQYVKGDLGVVYRLDVHPAYWLATKTTDCKVFQDKTVVDIMQEVFGKFSGLEVKYSVTGSYPKRKYCVQYNETDFDFLSRLMEDEGIFYYFEFQEGSHKLVVADTLGTSPEIPNAPTVEFDETAGGTRGEERINRWVKTHDLRSGKVTLRDHNFGNPTHKLEVKEEVAGTISAGTVSHKLELAGNKAWDKYGYPGDHAKPFDAKQTGEMVTEGNRRVKVRLQQEEACEVLIQANSNVRNMTAGHRFTLSKHFNGDGVYVVTSVTHNAQEAGMFVDQWGEQRSQYTNAFACVPVGHNYRPVRITPKPYVRGCQTARVVGPGGEEIYTDEFGRVKVQFHWDRLGAYDDKSSCWVRVASSWAGQQWGALHLPRIDQEVVVTFLEGDPDQPLIIGSVYNQDNMPPYALPDLKTVSTLKSRSSKGGGSSNYNEIRMEDQKGSEQLFIHAEKQMDVRTKEDWREFCGKDRHLLVKGKQVEEIQGDFHRSVKGKSLEQVNGNHGAKVSGNEEVKIGQKLAFDVGTEVHIKAGMKVIIEAGAQVSLKGPGGFVDIGPAGVTIQGTMVLINSGGSAGSGSGASPEAPEAPDQADDGTKRTKL